MFVINLITNGVIGIISYNMTVEIDNPPQENPNIQAELERLEALWKSDNRNQDSELTDTDTETGAKELLAFCQALVKKIGGAEKTKNFNGKTAKRVTAAVTDAQGFRWEFKLSSDFKVDHADDVYEEEVEFASIRRSSPPEAETKPLIPHPRTSEVVFSSPISRTSEFIQVTQAKRVPSHTIKYGYEVRPQGRPTFGYTMENTKQSLEHANSFMAKAQKVGRAQ